MNAHCRFFGIDHRSGLGLATLAFVAFVPDASAFQFHGSYHDGTSFGTLVAERDDAAIDFDWGTGELHPSLPVDNVSIRWTAQVVPDHSELYTFYATADDGVRVWVDGALIIDHWVVTAAVETTGTVVLAAGVPSSLTVEYFEAGGFATCKLEWSSPSQARAVVSAVSALEPFQAFHGGVFPATKPGQGGVEAVAATGNLGVGMVLSITRRSGSGLLYPGSRNGEIIEVDPQGPGSTGTTYLDISDRVWTGQDSGLLGAAFHPEFDDGASPFRGRLFVYYVHEIGGVQFIRLSRFQVPDGNSVPDPASETILIQQRLGPTLHRGGGLLFGTDGLLYLSIGDLGYAGDAQEITDFFNSCVLRIDVDEDPVLSHPISVPIYPGDPESFTANYSIPNDNPFIGATPGALEEYYALGCRNPHRMTLDPMTGTIIIGNVGSNTGASYEEVNILQAGGNYGWNFRESNANIQSPPATIHGTIVDPALSYPRSEGACVIGGFVYRGTGIPWLAGRYVFGDYTNNEIYFTQDGLATGPRELLTTAPSGLVTFGVDDAGEIYVSGGNSVLYRLESTSFTPEPPATLSGTGVFADLGAIEPVPSFRPYEVASPLYSDGARKRRWFAVPNDGVADSPGERIGFDPSGFWSFPTGTMFIKHFELPLVGGGERPLETRFIAHGEDGRYYGVTYKWRADGSDADLLYAGESELIEGQMWDFPSREDCNRCHNPTAGSVLGLRAAQLNTDLAQPGSGDVSNQLLTLDSLGLLDPPLAPGTIDALPAMARLDDLSAFLQTRGRSYLQANCAHCHLPDGPGRGEFDTRIETPFALQRLVNTPVAEDFGVTGARVIVPQDVGLSQLHHRLDTLGLGAMPPLARNLLDSQASDLVAAWIDVANDPTFDFQADYYQGQNFETFVLQRDDAAIDFDWGNGAPDPLVGNDNFSVRWMGTIQPSVTETFTFYATTDDGSRLWVDGQLLIDDWTNHAPQERTGTIALSAGQSYDVTMEYYEAGGGAVVHLEWSAPGQARALVLPVEIGNTAPVAFPQSVQVAAGDQIGLTLGGADAEQVGLDVAISRFPLFGTLTGLGADLSYTPEIGYVGPDSFAFVVSDGLLVSGEAEVSITVDCPYDCDGDGSPDDCSADCDGDGLPDACETDCNGNGTPDECEAFADCNSNGIPDDCEADCDFDGTPDDCEVDCNTNGTPDDCEAFADCNSNGTPDDCELARNDCNSNGVPDDCELASNDCNSNGTPDDCELAGNDCNSNGTPDECELTGNDCDSNGIPDDCELAGDDCNSNGVPDDCELAGNDCNSNGIPDDCELTGNDCNSNGTPDDCELTGNDCNSNGTPDDCELTGNDCNSNGIPDDCELAGNDCNSNGIPDDCELTGNDCNSNGTPDDCELTENDCNSNGTPDDCELAGNDCNSNGVPDDCELAGNDCDSDGIPDDCEADCDSDGTPDDCEGAPDCNTNGIPDGCDISSGTSVDSDGDGVPDECELIGVAYCVGSPNSVGPGAQLVALGSDVVASNDFRLRSEGLPAGVPGIHFFGPIQVQFPFGDGFRCVGGATSRIQPVNHADGAGVMDRLLDLTSPALAQVVSSSDWSFQLWYRDPAGPGGAGFNLTNGVSVSFQ